MKAYQDPFHEGNSVKYQTGRVCITKGCKNLAGTAWSPHWCYKHNVERMDRLSANIDDAVSQAKFSQAVREANEASMRINAQQCAVIVALVRKAGGTVTLTKEQLEKHTSYESVSHHTDGSRTYRYK